MISADTTAMTRPLALSDFEARSVGAGFKTVFRRRLAIPRGGWALDTGLGLGQITSRHPKAGRFGAFIQRTKPFKEIDLVVCPFGRPGDHLWVREGYQVRPDHDEPAGRSAILYQADHNAYGWKGKPAITMPKEYSRTTLVITDIRVEQLHQISNEQCQAEGCRGGHGSIPGYMGNATPWEHFRQTWLARGQEFDDNPLVWVVEFEKAAPAR